MRLENVFTGNPITLKKSPCIPVTNCMAGPCMPYEPALPKHSPATAADAPLQPLFHHCSTLFGTVARRAGLQRTVRQITNCRQVTCFYIRPDVCVRELIELHGGRL